MTESGRSRRCWPAALIAAGMLAVRVAAAAPAPASPPGTARPILLLPPLHWDSGGLTWGFATKQRPVELARVMNGLMFGMTTQEVSGHLPGGGSVLDWVDLPRAREFAQDVRYAWLPMDAAAPFRETVTACFGHASYVVLLFRDNALFRTSFRFLASRACPDPKNAAEQLYAAYTPLADTVAISTLYRTGNAVVVDVTSPKAGPLVAQRWQMRAP